MQDFSAEPYRGKIEETSPGKFKAGKTIITTLDTARSVYNKLRANHLKRISLYKEIEGLLMGNPPYNPTELRAAGLSHISNFNDMSARAVYERQALAYWNLMHNAEHMVKFVLRTRDPEAVHYADIMAQHWDYAVRNEWPSFLINLACLTAQIVKFGISPALFPDEKDPRWRVVELPKFFVPDQAQTDLDMLTTMLVETEFPVQYLWQVYQEFKDTPKERTPWNVKELGRLLIWAANSPTKDTILPHDMFELERKLYSGDIAFDRMYNDTVRIVSLFQTEYEGGVSHYMFHRHAVANPAGDGVESFLFFEQDQYKAMSEAVTIFTMNPGEYTIHANRGLGHKIYSLAQAKIMLDCSVMDMARWASTPILKSASLNAKDIEQIRFYPGVPLNIGTAEFVQNSLGANIQNVVGAAQYLNNLIQFNLTYSGADPASPDPDKGSLSPSQTRLMAFREFSVLKNQIMHFYATLDKLLRNMTAKMLRSREGYGGYEIARVWKERCLADGVPEVFFEVKEEDSSGMPKHLDVQATRVAGAGSQVAHLMGLQELQAIVGSFGAREEREFKRQFIMATLGPEYVTPFMQEGDDVDEKSGGASLAGVENAIMQMGKSPIFSMDNEHRSHAATHLALCSQVIQAVVQKKMTPIEADKIFTVTVPHTGEHVQALSKNIFAQSEFEQIRPQFEQVVQYATLNRKNAAKMAQAMRKQEEQRMAAQQQAMTEEELKTMQVVNEERRKDMKLGAQSKRQEAAGAAKEEALERRTESDIMLKKRAVEGDIEAKKMKAAASSGVDSRDTGGGESVASEYLAGLGGETPAPFDIEGVPRV